MEQDPFDAMALCGTWAGKVVWLRLLLPPLVALLIVQHWERLALEAEMSCACLRIPAFQGQWQLQEISGLLYLEFIRRTIRGNVELVLYISPTLDGK